LHIFAEAEEPDDHKPVRLSPRLANVAELTNPCVVKLLRLNKERQAPRKNE
jgi:hypothetical protein